MSTPLPTRSFATGPAAALPANRPLALDDSGQAWLIESGRVQVFAYTPGETAGRRVPLVSVEAGGLVMPPPQGSPVALLATGLTDTTTVRPVLRAALVEAADTGHHVEVIGLVEGWLEALTAAVAAPMPESGVSLLAEEPVSLLAGEIAWPATQTVWIPVAGDLQLFGDSSDRVPAGVLLPVPPQVWLRALEPVDLSPLDGADAFAAPAARAGVDALTGIVMARLLRRMSHEQELETETLDARAAYEASLREATYTGMGAVLGSAVPPSGVLEEGGQTLAALRLVGAAQGIEIVAPPRGAVGEQVDPVDAIARSSGVRAREIEVTGEWYRQDVGSFLGKLAESDRPVAVVPHSRRGYEIVDPVDGSRIPVNKRTAALLGSRGAMLYRTLPSEPVSDRQVLWFMLRPIIGDLRRLALFAIVITAISLLTPIVTKQIFNVVVPNLEHQSLAWMTALLVVFAIASLGFAYAQQLAILRAQGRASTDVQAALWDRVLDLPMPFFRDYSAGSLAMSVMGIEQIRLLATATVVTAVLAVPVGLGNLVEAIVFDWRLGIFATAAIALISSFMVVLIRVQIPRQRRVLEATNDLFGTTMQLVEAAGKLRVADAERRGFAQWGKQFAGLKARFYASQISFASVTALVAAAPAVGTLLLIVGASTIDTKLQSGTFLAFNTAFLQALAAVTGLTSLATFLAQAVPLYEKTRPILAAERESTEVRADPGRLNGLIEVSHVSLRYSQDGPLVLDDVSFTVEPGEFVAFVGPSGAGKSSIMRVLLGFETPEVGSVRFDGNDLESIDPHGLRRQMGVVVQSARLMPGDVLTNIVGARPLTLDDAWEAARIAGVADVIEALPMGMHTVVSEGGGTFSGGQRQRLLIARAVAGRPRILLFDEATSALDNKTQAAVSDAIEHLHATRIVIAHRLSTVRNANRIVVIEAGRIVQQGAYDELIAAEGPFQRLARRQLA